jgi:hypothetical protein
MMEIMLHLLLTHLRFSAFVQVELDKGLMNFIRAATQNYGKVRKGLNSSQFNMFGAS